MSMQTSGLRQDFKRLFAFLPARRRWQGYAMMGFMLFGAVAELATIGAVLPFLAVIASPNAVARYSSLRWLMALLGLHSSSSLLVALTVLFCGIAVTAAAIRIMLAWVSQRYIFRIAYDLGVALYTRILYQPYSFHVAHNSSDVLSGINKVQLILNTMLLPVLQGVTSLVIATFILGGLLAINAAVAITAGLVFGFIYFGVSIATRKRLRSNGVIIARASTLRMKAVQEGLGGIRDVLIDHVQPVYIGKFATIDTQLREAQAANAMIAASPRFVIESVGMVTIAVIALVLSRQPAGLVGSLPVLGALAVGSQRLMPLLQLIYNGWAQVMGNRASLADVLWLLDRPLPSQSVRRREPPPLPFGDAITLKDMSFRYAGHDAWVLRHIGLTIRKGERIGFVGKTGSGKSTLVDIVMGLLEPVDGTIEVDGVPLDAENVVRWQRQIAHVPQHIYLADTTILGNIAFGVPDAEVDHARAAEAAWKADIAAFIEELPEGYATVIGERGIRLSGGQRQRIGIARALYKRASVLILDEATSALDDSTEAAVMGAMDRLDPDLTVLIVAHRITTLRNCGLIYRLDRGKLAAQGSFETIFPELATQRTGTIDRRKAETA